MPLAMVPVPTTPTVVLVRDDPRRPGLVVGVEPAAGLAALEAGGVELAQVRTRREAGVVELGVDGLHDADERVDADEVGQGDRAHRQARAEPHGVVDVLHGGVARLDHADGLVEVREQQLVGDEAAPVADGDRDLADRLGERLRGLDHTLVGDHGADELDQLHDRGGVEEVEAEHTVGPLRVDGDVHDRQGGRVGRDDGLGGGDLVELRERLLLEGQDLRDGLDDEVTVGQRRPVGRAVDAGQDRVALRCVDLLPGHEALEGAGDALVPALHRRVVDLDEDDVDAVARHDLGDARPHRAAADDADLLDLRAHVPSPLLPGCAGCPGRVRAG
jgi:hypothetical protein